MICDVFPETGSLYIRTERIDRYLGLSESLIPPSLSSRSEIFFGPGGEEDLSIIGGVAVSKGERKRGRSTDDVSIRSVLGSVTRAHELVVGS